MIEPVAEVADSVFVALGGLYPRSRRAGDTLIQTRGIRLKGAPEAWHGHVNCNFIELMDERRHNRESPPSTSTHVGFCVDVEAPARLHLGFLDLNGGLGRRFGSIGLTIDSISTRLRAWPSPGFSATGPGAERAVACARAFAAAQGISDGAHLVLQEAIPDHVGLGSGTQMSLAVGTALQRLYTQHCGIRSVAHALQRGRRSGIGIGAFEEGGFMVDSGRGNDDGVPPVAVRLPFPDHWRMLLILDSRGQGMHGEHEVEAFARLPVFPEDAAGRLCRLVMMKVLPGLLEQRLQVFAEAIGEIQRVVGDYFAPAQGGRFTSPAVSEALAWAESQGIAGVGQSSWGPTGFVVLEDEAQALQLTSDLKRRFGELSPLRYRTVGARNQGARVSVVHAPTRIGQEKRTR